MTYTVLIDELVLEDDLKRVGPRDRARIFKAIREKLTTEPDRYGQPLRGGLKGYWKLRVGEFRVIYEIQKEKIVVYVIKVGLRRNEEVYREVLKRLG